MSDMVSFSADIFFQARAATVETIFAYLRTHAPDDPEFRTLVAREREFDAIGGWSFNDLSPDALQRLRRLTDAMAADLPGVAAAGNWSEKRKPVFYADVERFRENLARRLAQLT